MILILLLQILYFLCILLKMLRVGRHDLLGAFSDTEIYF